jgi:hypothetical protein
MLIRRATHVAGFTSQIINDIRRRVHRNIHQTEQYCTPKQKKHDNFTYIFFFRPFLPPFESPLFFPTAMFNMGALVD